jgi:TetR/AcrR family transcriptional regulator, cholesterol catabolism regulator
MIDETKLNILSKAESLFMKYGLRSVSIDDICREIGCSKKTIYQYFESKNEIVSNIGELHKQKDIESYALFKEESKNAIQEVLKIADYTKKEFKKLNPVMLHDLQKYYKEIFCVYHDKYNKLVHKNMTDNLVWGMEEGLYRKLNAEFISILFVNSIHCIFTQEEFLIDKYDLQELYAEAVDYHFRGILTEEGMEIYETNKNIINI